MKQKLARPIPLLRQGIEKHSLFIKSVLIAFVLSVLPGNMIDLGAANNLNLISDDSQQQKVTGTVRDAKTDEPLAGVNVSVQGTTVGTLTDAAGNYSIVLPGSAKILVFTYVGYAVERVQLEGQATIDVKMTLADLSLDEVVVVGYGTARKSDISGSVSSVNREEMLKKSPTNIVQGLKGAAAGVDGYSSGWCT